jgi:hypothetical protein
MSQESESTPLNDILKAIGEEYGIDGPIEIEVPDDEPDGLKPCPFCGRPIKIVTNEVGSLVQHMTLADCPMQSSGEEGWLWDTPENLELALNTRPAEDALRAEVARLTGILSGDPNLTATKEQREAWRISAVRYAEKLEAEMHGYKAVHVEAVTEYDSIIKRLKAELHQAREAERWIPVGERLPEASETVLLYNGDYMAGKLDWVRKNGQPVFLVLHSKLFGELTMSNATHWRPLPSAPEREE